MSTERGFHPIAPWRPNDYTRTLRDLEKAIDKIVKEEFGPGVGFVFGYEDEMTRMFGPGPVFTPKRSSASGQASSSPG